ncbi:MAG: ACT domain-containing protein [Clostridia bacterium]|nr:ACT domain-containing protein [Clostridia bacterium]
MKTYLYVDSEVLPDYFFKVLSAKKLLESGKTNSVTEAVRLNGISRSTYYKYKDSVYEATRFENVHYATFFMLLTHEPGVLSNVLSYFSAAGASVLTISQSLPIGQIASVTVTVDLNASDISPDTMLESVAHIDGVSQAQLIGMN